jgi:hypothetical protein
MTFPEPGSGPTFEYDELWEDVPLISDALETELRGLGDRAAVLYSWLSAPRDLVGPCF